MWFKYKQSMSYGEDKEWTYISVPNYYVTLNQVKEYLIELDTLDMWSEQYRSVKIRKATHLPTKFVVERIKRNIKTIKAFKKENQELRKMLPPKKKIDKKTGKSQDFLGKWSRVIASL